MISVLTISGQDKKGFIDDPDGYTNVRESADIKSKIVGKIIEGEIFKYNEIESQWYPVITYSGIKGFVHYSRIKEFKINRDFCSNPYFTQLFLYRKNNTIFSVCGINAPEIKEFECYSGLIVYDVLNEIKLLEFGEGQYQSFEFIDGDIIVKEYSNIPTKKDLSTSFTPFSINKILFAGERIIVQKSAPFYNFPRLTKAEVKATIDDLKTKIVQEKDYYFIINTALVLALNDSTIGVDFLLNLCDHLNIRFDGEFGEKYMDILMIYEINKNNR